MVKLTDVSITFGSVMALKKVNWEIHSGEIHALIGEHGAGKSTLAHILSGFLPHTGTVYWCGQEISKSTDQIFRSKGVRFVTQKTEMFNYLSVAHNIISQHTENHPKFFINQKNIFSKTQNYFDRVGCYINPRTLVEELTLSEKILIDILRQLHHNPRLLILDEAMEKLTNPDFKIILNLIIQLRNSGGSVVFITHRIDDVYAYADRVSIMRKGQIIISETTDNIDKINLIKLAYTQILNKAGSSEKKKDFYNLLKYNEAILESLPITLLVVDRENYIRILNLYGTDFFSKEYSRIINRKLNQLFDNENVELCLDIEHLIGMQTIQNIYNRKIIIGQSQINCNITIEPILDGNYYLGSILIIDDITEQEKMREKNTMSEKLASIGLLAAGVSHEINNPLEIINNFIDIIKSRITEPEICKYLRFIEAEVDSIEHILSKLIIFSEKNYHEDVKIDLYDLTSEIVILLKSIAHKRHIALELKKFELNSHVFADENKIKQIIMNLARNAFEAMPEGGQLSINFEIQDDTFITVNFVDTGIGFSEDNLKNILIPFYTTKNNKNNNMGLGLSIVFGILDDYGGNIRAENRSDSPGSIVSISLPLFKDEVSLLKI